MTIRAKAHLTDESGAMVVEYALLLAVISLAVAVQLLGLRPPICQLINNVSQMLGAADAGSACVGEGPPLAIGGGNGNNGNGGNSGNNGNNGNGNGTGNGKGNNGIGGGTGGGASNGGGPNR